MLAVDFFQNDHAKTGVGIFYCKYISAFFPVRISSSFYHNRHDTIWFNLLLILIPKCRFSTSIPGAPLKIKWYPRSRYCNALKLKCIGCTRHFGSLLVCPSQVPPCMQWNGALWVRDFLVDEACILKYTAATRFEHRLGFFTINATWWCSLTRSLTEEEDLKPQILWSMIVSCF